MVENNPHKISTMGTGNSLAAITDGSDFPHSGLIKGLSQMARQNIVVKNNSNDFDITQSTANGGTVTVSAGTYLRDGKKYVAQYKTGTTAAVFTFSANELSNAVDKGYHLVVVDKNNFILIRKPTVLNKVPDYTSGDTIIAVFEYASTSSSGAMNIQYLTTDKTENSVSIAYAAGTGDNLVYTEASAITGTSDGLFISGIGTVTPATDGSDKVIIQDANASDVIKSVTVAQINALAPQGDITGITAGTNLSGGGTTGAVTLNVDDAFLINSGSDTTTGTITAAGFTTAGAITLGGHAFNDIDIGSEFVDADDHLMSSGAIKEKIEGYGYTTNVGDITGVALTAGTGIDLTSVANATAGDYAATIAVDVSDFMTNGVNNRVVTATGTDGMNAEAGLTVTDALTSITSGITQINKNLALMPQGGIGFVADTPIMYISDANNSLTLPAASSHINQVVIIKNMKSANLTITITGGDRFEDNQTYSKDSRWVDVSNVRLLPLQSIRLQAVNDGSIVIPIATGDDAMASGWMIVDSTTINVDTVYTHPNHSGEVTSTGDGATVIIDNIVDEANLKVSNTPTNGYALTAQSGNTGGLTWAAVGSGDITEVVAGDGLTGGASTGSATLTVVGGTGITANANDIAITAGGVGTTQLADDAVTSAKLANNIDIAGTLDVTGVTTLDDNLVVATAKTLLARRLPVVALNASTTLTEADHAGRYVFIIGGSRVITLPDNQGAGVHFTIINNDGNGFTLRTGTNSISGDLMNGVDDDIAVAARNGVTCISTGTDYVVLGV